MNRISLLNNIPTDDLIKEKYDCNCAFYTGLDFTEFKIGNVYESICSSTNEVLLSGNFEIKRIEIFGNSEPKSISGYHNIIFISMSSMSFILINNLLLDGKKELIDLVYLAVQPPSSLKA